MKKKSLLIVLLIICNICKAKYNNFSSNSILIDTTIIHQIKFSTSGNPGWDSQKELDKKFFTITFEENGKVLLQVEGRNFNPRDHIIVSYNGKISKRKFKMLSNKLERINFITLNNEYLTYYEDTGRDIYLITYNRNKQKKILDENFDVDGLKEFRKMLIKLKKEIKWTAVN